MPLHRTERERTPYLFHFKGQTVALGNPEFLFEINDLLLKAGISTRPTFWDQAYFEGPSGEYMELKGTGVEDFGAANDKSMLNSVGANLEREEFWDAIEKGVFLGTSWPVGNAPLVLNEVPVWLKNARSWEFDSVLPPDGPGEMGGWARLDERAGAGYPVGLFQLTSEDSFWVLGSADDLDGIMELCCELAPIRTGFSQATGFIGTDARYNCLALPMGCRQVLQEELFAAGVYAETLFWE